jgi:hypothetical protein
MDWYMCLYVKHIQLTYARLYAPDIRQSISHMHGLYWIHTSIYLHVYACICMYFLSLRGCIKCIWSCMPFTYRHIHTHMDWNICMYVKHIQLTYDLTYAPDIRQSISHMHGVYEIHTCTYLHVWSCMPFTYRHIHTHMDWNICMYVKHIQLTYALTYAPDIRQSISHMHWSICDTYSNISACICMYLYASAST